MSDVELKREMVFMRQQTQDFGRMLFKLHNLAKRSGNTELVRLIEAADDASSALGQKLATMAK